MRAPLLYLLLGVAAAKLAILLVNGPSFMEDSGVYVDFADAILDHGRAFAPVDWGAEAAPPFIFRLAGYPLLIAAAKLLAPKSFAVVLVLLQGALDLVVIALVYRVAEAVLRSRRGAVAACVMYAATGSILWDNAILSDSLYASCYNIVIFALLGRLLGCWRLPLGGAAALGAVWGYSIWTRDSGVYFTIVPLVLLAAIAWRGAGSALRRAAPALLFLAVSGAMVGGYMALNWYRTGEAFLGITGEENWLRPLFDMEQLGYAHPFAGDDLISRTVRETMTGYDFPAQVRFVETLHARCRCTPTALQAMTFAKYRAEALRHPAAYLRVVVRNFNYFGLASDIADPVFTVNQFAELGTKLGRRVVPGLSLRGVRTLGAHFAWGELGLMLVGTIASAIAAVLFATFLFGLPWLAWRGRRTPSAALRVASFLWLDFMAVSVAFSMVHYEARHAMPVFPAAEIGIVYALMRLKPPAPGRADDGRRQRSGY